MAIRHSCRARARYIVTKCTDIDTGENNMILYRIAAKNVASTYAKLDQCQGIFKFFTKQSSSKYNCCWFIYIYSYYSQT